MHHASLNSPRLQVIYNALLLGPKTSKALQSLCNDMAIATSVAEARQVLQKSGRGDISCTYQGRTAGGRKVYLYTLIKGEELPISMKITSCQMERFVKRAVKYLGCDTARIPQGCDTLFLIIGTNRNTKKDREEGRTTGVVSYKAGKLYDFDYVEEHVIANGKDLKELWVSVQWYRKVQKEGWKASPKEIMARMPVIKDKKIIEWLKGLGRE